MSQQKIMAYWMKKRRTEPLKKGGGGWGAEPQKSQEKNHKGNLPVFTLD